MTTKKNDQNENVNIGGGLSGFLGGLTNLVEKLGELAEKAEDFSGGGEISGLGGARDLKGVYGFNVRVGLGGEDKITVEPFGNIRRDKESGKTVVQEVREPLADVFEEEDHTLVIVEMPGIGGEDVEVHIKDDVLTISAERGQQKYLKEVLLPRSYSQEDLVVSCNNGILEIKCRNEEGDNDGNEK